MQKSYIKEQINEVKKYLYQQQCVDKLYEDKDQLKEIVMTSNYWKNRRSIIASVVSGQNMVKKSTIYGDEKPKENPYMNNKSDEYEKIHTEDSYSIEDGFVIFDLCQVFDVPISQDLKNIFGEKLNNQQKVKADAQVDYDKKILALTSSLRKNIFQKCSFDTNAEELFDDQIYQIVSKLPDFETEGKKLLLEFYKQEKNPKEELKQPAPVLFNLLEDKNLKTYIDDYKTKSLKERSEDPLRYVFRWNNNTQNYNLNDMTKNKTIKQWFESLMTGTSEEDRQDVYFILLELFGKDFEFGGGFGGKIPKARLWDKVDKKEAREWYRKNMSDTDLFGDLQIEEEEKIVTEEKKTVIIEEQNYNNIDATAKENKSLIKGKNFNMDISKKNGKENGTEKKQSETSKTGYKIGLFLDILVTAVFVYLAITMSLYFLMALVVTVPLAIFFGLKLSARCLSGSCFKFVTDKPQKNSEYDTLEHENNRASDIDLEKQNDQLIE